MLHFKYWKHRIKMRLKLMIYLGDLLRVRRFSYSLVLYYSWLKYDNVQKWVVPAGLRLLSLESPSCKSGPQLASRNFDFGRVPTIMANCAWTVCANNIVYAEYLLVFGRNLGTCLEAGSSVTSPSKKTSGTESLVSLPGRPHFTGVTTHCWGIEPGLCDSTEKLAPGSLQSLFHEPFSFADFAL